MKVLFDLIHPANFHYFKYTMEEMANRGHQIRITARNKDVLFALLQNHGYSFFNMGRSHTGKLNKILYLIKAEIFMFWNFITFRPDLIISFSSSFAAHNAFLFHKTHITFDDTEHHKFNRKAYLPFSKIVFTPNCFMLELGDKQIRFPGYMELFYLHPKRFMPDKTILKELGVNEGEKFVLLRFVSWGAFHDIGQSGLTVETKINLVNELSKYSKVFISSEGEMAPDLKKYKLPISPEKIHHVMYFASLFIGEGSTMASECALLGTPAVYVNSLELGYMNELDLRYGLAYNFRTSEGVVEKAVSLISNSNLKMEAELKRIQMLKELIDPTKMLIWFIENYPKSLKLLKTDKDVMKTFK